MISITNNGFKKLIIKLVFFSLAVNFLLFFFMTHSYKALAIDCTQYGQTLKNTNERLNDNISELNNAVKDNFMTVSRPEMEQIATGLRTNIDVQQSQLQLYAGSCNDKAGFENYKSYILDVINKYNTVARQPTLTLPTVTAPTLDWNTLHPTTTPGATATPPINPPTHLSIATPTSAGPGVYESLQLKCTIICQTEGLDAINPVKWVSTALCNIMCIIDDMILGFVQWIESLINNVPI